MKIAEIRTHLLCHKLDVPFHSSFSTFTERWACLVEITCDDGTTGWGECLGPARPNAAIVQAMAPLLIGRDPLQIEPIWTHLYNQFRDQGQRGLTVTAQSGIDIALWDIAGHHFGMPVHVLAGGAYRSSVPAYATGGFMQEGRDRVAALADELAAYAAAGFTAAKIKIGYGHDLDVAAVRAARQVLGPDRALMIDANHGYDAVDAIRLGRAVADQDIDWFEEPVVPEQLDAYVQVRRGQPIPVAGGETWHTRTAHAQALNARAVDILQPDVAGCGGITEMRKIAAMAETAGVRVVPHVWGTGVHVAASLQMLTILPPSPQRHAPSDPWLEFDQTDNPFRMAILKTPIACQNGRVAIPDAPGLGVDIDRDALTEWRAPDPQ
ncbi:L-alanine-DL-glutamate epimerase and related enzymes of enolase superfamily [Rhodovulum sp. P5]|uniref:mandelate racemase/muconate lactonizing enzyme family protein n=1 Tax=Rhodovulum sp. P5 TaxID=1564506 RepID=UPI0009C1C559|nr:mandelate racemase/muconate lactonizing enzyme family protein [Rhodovulum sp. P5]ARE42079.1 L-alanine-DL-glutamate epimerase and related enzymes of enolase superfamily [Rhodovulum sp. P5]